MTRGLALVSLLLTACVFSNEGAPDATVYDTVDASPLPEFRDAGCGGGGSSGTSGTSGATCLGDGGSSTPADAAVPDAAPPCDLVTFRYTDGTATSVWVTGSFSNWEATPAAGAWQLIKVSPTEWSKTGQIGAGRHIYKIIVNGDTWIADPGNPNSEPDGFGGQNSVIEVCSLE
jgi:hypothetical protein